MTLIEGDCVEVMRSMPEDSVDALCLDPPAGISFMSRSWDSDKGGRRQWVAWFTEVMEEALRVAKPGAHAFVWALPRTSHWTAWALEDAGWEIREVVHHIFGSGFPKSKNLGNGFGTALKPAAENWILARKPLSESSVARNVLSNGCGAINIEASRVDGKRWPANVILSHHSECQRVGVKRVRGSLPASGPTLTGKSTSVARGKFNGVEGTPNYTDPDGFEEVEAWECVDGCPVRLLDEQSGIEKDRPAKKALTGEGYTDPNERNAFGKFNGKACKVGHQTQGGASRFFKTFEKEPGFKYQAKASRSERNAFTKPLPRTKNLRKRYQQDKSGRWYKRVSNNHPTVKPLALMRYLVKLVCPPGGVVLDPFMGSGSTLVAAIQEGFDAVGIEQDAAYLKLASRRVAHEAREKEPSKEPPKAQPKPKRDHQELQLW